MSSPTLATFAGPLHPADELYLVRQQIRRLRRREADLASHLVSAIDRCGSNWLAIVTRCRTPEIDVPRLPLSIRADPRYRCSVTRTAVELAPNLSGSEAAASAEVREHDPPDLRVAPGPSVAERGEPVAPASK